MSSGPSRNTWQAQGATGGLLAHRDRIDPAGSSRGAPGVDSHPQFRWSDRTAHQELFDKVVPLHGRPGNGGDCRVRQPAGGSPARRLSRSDRDGLPRRAAHGPRPAQYAGRDGFGKPCPSCSRWTLRRLARHPRYYRCSACGGRFKWFGLGPWLDASGPEDAARYRKRTEAGTWKGFAAPKDLGATTSGRLLQSKRTRDLPGELKHQPHPPTRQQRLDDAERKARNALNHLRDLRE